jgi:hypothetical protein
MPTGTKGDYQVGYGEPPRNAGFKKGSPATRADRARKACRRCWSARSTRRWSLERVGLIAC